MSTLLATALVLGTGVAIAQSGDDDTDDGTTTTEVLGALQFNVEEERMARDLYDELGEAHDGLAPFTQIQRSEQKHHEDKHEKPCDEAPLALPPAHRRAHRGALRAD